jgi:hypothetical protein
VRQLIMKTGNMFYIPTDDSRVLRLTRIVVFLDCDAVCLERGYYCLYETLVRNCKDIRHHNPEDHISEPGLRFTSSGKN